MTLIDFQQGPDDELLLRCDCGDDLFLSFSRHELHGYGTEFYLSVCDTWRSPRGLWGRIKATLELFRRGEYTRSEVLLSKKDLADIRRWVDQYVAKTVKTE